MVEYLKNRNELNYGIITSNLDEAIGELQYLRDLCVSGELDEVDFRIRLQHAYHHINFAWHIRHISTCQYQNLTRALFKRWGKYPKIECMGEDRKRRSRKRRKGQISKVKKS